MEAQLALNQDSAYRRIVSETGLKLWRLRQKPLLEPLQSNSTVTSSKPYVAPGTMDSKLHIITTPTADTPGTTLVLQTAKRNYIFGQESEGTQRALTEMGHRLTKVQDFFVTGKTEWSNMGGLIGMALTLADASSSSYETTMERYQKDAAKNTAKKTAAPVRPKLNLYGSPNLKHMLATCRRFIFRKGVPLIATEYKSEMPMKVADGAVLPTWEDENIQVWALPVAPADMPQDPEAEAELTSRCSRFDATQNGFDDHQAPQGESLHDREIRYDHIRTAVLNHMFDSAWSFDTLVERHISEVEMPTVMYVRNPHTQRLEIYKGPMPGGEQPLPDVQVLTRTPWPGARVLALPPTSPAPESVSYVVRTRTVRGRFDAARAKQLGLKPGPIFSQLSNGIPVTNENGETITPDMVMGPDRLGQGFAILDVPSAGHLESLVRREEFTSSSVMDGVKACIWILGSGLSRHPTLTRFMQKLDQVKHVISSSDESPNRLALDSVAAQTIRLGQIDPERYHIPDHDNITLPQNDLHKRASLEGELLSNVLVAERGLTFRLMPKFDVIRENIPPILEIAEIKKDTSSDIIDLASAAHASIGQDQGALESWKKLLARPDTEVITLGTGSALPSKFRNVSATLVRVPGIGNYLFDCGENTLGQLRRVFNPDELAEVIRNLRMIWISHLHADHHLGTASVIKAWYEIVHKSVPARSPRTLSSISTDASMYGLSVVSHDGMLNWLNEYSSVEDFGYSRIVPLQISPASDGSDSGSRLALWPYTSDKDSRGYVNGSDYQTIMGVSDIQACRVSHCFGAMAVSLTFPDAPEDVQSATKPSPLKVSYSGDCRPSSKFAFIGRGTTVLIHEATFDDELKGDAVAKKHSTTSEALGIGAQMGAKAVVLTHFSQRYQKIPVLQTVENGEDQGEVLDPNAMATEEPAEDQDVDMTADNMDMNAKNLGVAEAALPTDKGVPCSTTNEKVIKIKSKDMKVAIAFDYMRVKIGDIAKLEKFNKALNKLLVTDEEKVDGGAAGEEDVVNANGKRKSPNLKSEKKKSRRNN